MNKLKLITVPLITICMIGGPPAAELTQESKKAGHHEVLPPGSHDHPLGEQNTSHVDMTYNAAFTTSSPNINVVRSMPGIENWPVAFFSLNK